ncbi:hypothetical protein GCM10020255_002080 [Rhodococcus baikonurensis]
MYVSGSDFGARWDVRFTFEPSPELQEILLTVIARISRDTLRFDGMREFDPGCGASTFDETCSRFLGSFSVWE